MTKESRFLMKDVVEACNKLAAAEKVLEAYEHGEIPLEQNTLLINLDCIYREVESVLDANSHDNLPTKDRKDEIISWTEKVKRQYARELANSKKPYMYISSYYAYLDRRERDNGPSK